MVYAVDLGEIITLYFTLNHSARVIQCTFSLIQGKGVYLQNGDLLVDT